MTGAVAPAAQHADGLDPPRRYWAIAVIAIAIVMAVMDGTLINLALPLIALEMDASPSLVIWIVSAYQLAITVSLFPLSALGERLGYREVYCAGLLVFTLASLVCALSDSVPMLIAARVLQGLGASGVMSVNLALVRFIYPRNLLGRGIGYNGLIVALAASAGPTVASGLLSVASWQWLFGVNLPLGIAALAIGSKALPGNPKSRSPIDWTGAALSAAAIGFFIYALDGLGRDGASRSALAQFAASAILMFGLYLHQRGKTRPIIPLDLLRIPVVGLSSLTAVLCYVVQSLAYVGMPFLFHDELGFSVVEVGIAMTGWPLALAAVSPLSGRLSDRFSAGRLGTIGLSVLALGLSLMILLPDQPSILDVVWRMALCGIGFGLFQSPNSKAIVGSSPADRSGASSALQSAARLFGQTLGATFVAILFASHPDAAAQGTLYLALACALGACLTSFFRTLVRN